MPGQCGSNVRNLLLKYSQDGRDISDAQVILLLHEQRTVMANGPIMPGKLRPQRLPNGKPATDLFFEYHVVVLIDDQVYDPDFGPSGSPIQTYATAMFDRPHTDKNDPNEKNILDRIELVEIPATEYLQKWSTYAEEILAQDPHHTINHEEYARGKTITYFRQQAGASLEIKSLAQLATQSQYAGRFQEIQPSDHPECKTLIDVGPYRADVHFLSNNPHVSVLHFVATNQASNSFDSMTFTGRVGHGDASYAKEINPATNRRLIYRLEGLIDPGLLFLKTTIRVIDPTTDTEICRASADFFATANHQLI